MNITPEKVDAAWFTHDRFGLFIHWGLFSLAARAVGTPPYSEWLRHTAHLTEAEYERYFEHFDPDLFNPQAWALEAKNAGMRYAVLTTKHHDGFCLWDSELTDYKATRTPAGRDLVAEFVTAFRAEGLKVGFYYSLIDWHHPDFVVDGLHPQRDDLAYREANADRDMQRYTKYLHGQVRELLTRYGKIDLLWFDFSYPQHDWGWSKGKGPEAWRAQDLLETICQLQPDILVNNRLGLGGDFVTPEQVQPLHWPEMDGERVRWEACQTLNGAWGYVRDNHTWKSSDELLRLLIDSVSKGGNMLLNVGPDARGLWQDEAVTRLRTIGEWLQLHERALRGCTASDFAPPPDARLTQNGDRLYLHLFAWPMTYAYLENLAGRVRYAQFLHDASEVCFSETPSGASEHEHMSTPAPPGTVRLELPARRPEVLVPVVELFLVAP